MKPWLSLNGKVNCSHLPRKAIPSRGVGYFCIDCLTYNSDAIANAAEEEEEAVFTAVDEEDISDRV